MNPTGEAGQRGDDIRSDCWVQVALVDSGGIQTQLTSKVAALYGDSIRQLVDRALATFGVKHAAVEIHDKGALPYVLMARLEAAAIKAGVDVGDGCLPDFGTGTQDPSQRYRFRRSRLYLPGNEPKFMLNAGLHQPDGIILDLEDSVAPSVKDDARLLVRNALRAINFQSAERMVRINQGQRGLVDLEHVVPHNVHLILIPKVESAGQVREVDEAIARIRAQGNRQSPVFLMPIVESAAGAIRAFEIATASENIVALAIGLEDYTADIGAQRSEGGRESFWARSQVVNAARAANIQPIDTVYSDVANTDGLRASVREAKSLGFDGKGCIHPRQIRVIHEAFAPTAEELETAQRIVAAFEEAQSKGLAAVSLGSKMIDPPVVKRALRVVEMAKTYSESL